MNDIDIDLIAKMLDAAVQRVIAAENIPGLVEMHVKQRLDMVLNSASRQEIDRVVREAVKNGVSVHLEVKRVG